MPRPSAAWNIYTTLGDKLLAKIPASSITFDAYFHVWPKFEKSQKAWRTGQYLVFKSMFDLDKNRPDPLHLISISPHEWPPNQGWSTCSSPIPFNRFHNIIIPVVLFNFVVRVHIMGMNKLFSGPESIIPS